MRKRIIIALLILLIMSGCDKHTTDKWKIDRVDEQEGIMVSYSMRRIGPGNGFNIEDTAGKWNVGDTVCIELRKFSKVK